MIRGLYTHRDSVLHRAPAGVKLAALPVLGTILFAVPSSVLAGTVLAASLGGYRLAQLPLRTAWQQIRPVLLVLALIFLAQVWFADLAAAVLSVVRLAALILLAALVTQTTRTSDLVAVLERAFEPLRPLGIDPARIGLAISMTIRFIPMAAGIVAEVREAQAARGMEHSTVRLAVPVILRLLKASDEIADAIDARR